MSTNNYFTDLNFFLNQYGGGVQGWNLNGDLYDVLGSDNGECDDGLFSIVSHIPEQEGLTSKNQKSSLEAGNVDRFSTLSDTQYANPNTYHNSCTNTPYVHASPNQCSSNLPPQNIYDANKHSTYANNMYPNSNSNIAPSTNIYQTNTYSNDPNNTFTNNDYTGTFLHSHYTNAPYDGNYPTHSYRMNGEDAMEDVLLMQNSRQDTLTKIESDEDYVDSYQKKRKRSSSFHIARTSKSIKPSTNKRTQSFVYEEEKYSQGVLESLKRDDMYSPTCWPSNNFSQSISTVEVGSVKLSSKMDKYNLFMIDGLLYIRRDKCLAFEVKLPFKLPSTLPEISYRLKVRQRDANHYTNVFKENFVEYEFNGLGVTSELATIPEAHIDRERGILRIPFKLTKGQKDLVEGYKNIFKLQFIIRCGENLGCSIWFSFRYDSRGNEKKNNYKSVTHICGQNQVWICPMGKGIPMETTSLSLDTPVILMEPRIIED